MKESTKAFQSEKVLMITQCDPGSHLYCVYLVADFYYAEKSDVLNGEKVVVYNWGEYIDPEVLTMFEEETGIRCSL